MSHLTGILDKTKSGQTRFTDGFADIKKAQEMTEGWETSNPAGYSALMTKADEINDFINDSQADYEGLVADLLAIAGG